MSFVSSGNSRLVIDAYLGAGAEAQNACGNTPATYAGFADCITIGASSGTGTRLTVVDANSAGNGALNLTGTVVVDGTSGSAGDFFLSTSDPNVVSTPQGPAIVKGFVQYQLVFDSANSNWDLVGLPSAGAIELAKLTAGLQSLWYETAGSWNERTSLLRYDFANDRMARGWSIWGKAYYGRIDRDSSNAVDAAGSTVLYDTSYGQNYYGFQIGADHFMRNANNGAWVFGVLGGYNKSSLEFSANADKVEMSVYNVGGYVSYLRGPVFADLLVKDDIAKFDFKLPALSALDDINANSIGGELTVGGRFGGTGGMGLVIEPLATLAYVNTTVDSMDWMGMNFAWEDGTSFRGTLAVRLSADFRGSETTLQPFILGGVGQEFNGNNKLTLTSGDSLVLSDKPIKTFGVASLGLNAFSTGGLSGYVRADGMLGSNYTSVAMRLGIRYRFGAAP